MVIPILNMGSETRNVSDGIEKFEFDLRRARIEDLAANRVTIVLQLLVVVLNGFDILG